MKTLINLAFCLIASLSFASRQGFAPGPSIPSWGVPVTTERYYYIPDIETYYDIPSREYIYLDNGVWVRSAAVPAQYRKYDFYSGRKIVINDYRGNAPYTFYNVHRVKYVPAYRPKKVFVKPMPPNARGHAYGHMPGHARGRSH
ncbi:MAG: hypothetical protein EOO48_04560 [Flavobacterium sp.]|nr:MAG: hypothetical protein EOO48_04560 [Flavobacterium sp.]